MPNEKMPVGVAWYYKEQWDKIRSHSKDRDRVAKRYEDWESKALDYVKKLESEGVPVHRTYIDVDMLVAWCKRQGVDVDGKSRSDYASIILAQRFGSTDKL
jgi:hypothetical protein